MAEPGLSWGTWELWSSLQPVGSLAVACELQLRHVGSSSLTRDWTWSPALGATEPPGKSLPTLWRAESLFSYSSRPPPQHKALLFFKARCSGGSLSWGKRCTTFGLGSPKWGEGPRASGGGPLRLWYFWWVAHPGVWVLTILHLHSSYVSHCGSFLMSLVVKKKKNLFW